MRPRCPAPLAARKCAHAALPLSPPAHAPTLSCLPQLAIDVGDAAELCEALSTSLRTFTASPTAAPEGFWCA
eukprot:56412-Chlamydomonas_euryale.AAC.1